MLTSCNEYRKGESITDVPSEIVSTAVTEETTAETTKSAQTASDEETPQAADIPMEIKTYEPFGNASYTIDINKIDPNADSPLSTGIVNFIQELKTARQFMQADNAIYDSEEYTDTATVLEGDDGAAFVYKPLKTEIAKNEDELFSYLRKFFTQNYISNEELRDWLFADDYDNKPRYKTIDGQLCIRCGYDSVMTTIEPDKIWVLTLGESGDYLSIAANAHGVDYPPYYAIMSIQLSNERSWLLDSLEFKMYDQALCDVVFNGLVLRDFRLKTILNGYSGAKKPENPRTITIDGESYTEADVFKTIDLMREFFAETFAETIYCKDDQGNITGTKNLCEDYTKKYIDDVYIEQDGVIYRRDSAPVWILPYYVIDTDKSVGSGSRLGEFNAVIELASYNYHDEEYEISLTSRGEVVNGEEVIYEILVTSELPIKELE